MRKFMKSFALLMLLTLTSLPHANACYKSNPITAEMLLESPTLISASISDYSYNPDTDTGTLVVNNVKPINGSIDTTGSISISWQLIFSPPITSLSDLKKRYYYWFSNGIVASIDPAKDKGTYILNTPICASSLIISHVEYEMMKRYNLEK